MSESTGLAVILIFALIQLTSFSSARIPFFEHTSNVLKATYRASSPLNPLQLAPYVPAPAPVPLPSPAAQPSSSPGSVASPPHHKHHKRVRAHASSPSFSTPQAGCDEIECSEPLTGTPIGSPCGCVFPMRIIVDLNVAPYLLFTHIAELEVEIASGTFLKQSQVKIMAAVPSIQDQQKTRVTIYLVPLREKFDDMTAFFIYQRVSHKQVLLTLPIFGDYQVVSVNYPGLPSAPPGLPEGSTGLGPGTSGGTKQRPLTADIHSNSNSNKSQKLNAWIIIVITVSSFGLVLACFGLLLLIWRWRNLRINGGGSVGPTTNATTNATTGTKSKRSAGLRSMALSASMGSSSVSGMSRALVEGGTGYPASVRSFSLGELSKATEEFSAGRVIGEGGFGRVYRGTLETGVEVAVKLLTREDRTGEDREFVAEVEMLSRLHHRNLVKLIGICIQGTKRCLVYELITNGSVESHLHGVDKTKGLLNWETRMKIALGAARGLAYLHEDSNPRVIHRDFKASNILLEDDFTPKVTDFGLAREAPEGTHHISTRVMGTFGYVAPEYAMTGHVLVKSDVYSYGVVLLELLSGRKPVYMSESQGPENLVIWARSLLGTREGLEKLIDPCLNGKYEFDDVAKVASIASMCVHGEVSQRPFMGEVVQALKLVYNDTDDACDDSCSPRESESNADLDGSRGEWWNGNSSPFITMDYFSSGGMEGAIERPHSIDSLNRVEPMYNRSGPLRSKKNFFASFYRLRGSVSDHANLTKHSRIDRSYFN